MDGWNVGNYFPFGESLCSKAILVSRSVVFFKFLECTCCASGWVAWTWWWSQCLENNQPISSLWTGSKSTQKSLGWGHDIQTCSKSISTIHGRHVFKLKKAHHLKNIPCIYSNDIGFSPNRLFLPISCNILARRSQKNFQHLWLNMFDCSKYRKGVKLNGFR